MVGFSGKGKISVLMVCLGNICRSPTAHAVMKKYIENNGLSQSIYVDSAGTGTWHIGEPPDSRAIAKARKRGYQLESYRARQVNAADFENFSFILAMDEENQRDLLKQSPESQKEKISLLLDHSSSEPSAVPELYYSGEKGFDLVLDLIEEACAELLETLSSKIQAHP